MDTTLTQGLLARLDAVTATMGVAATEVWSIWLATAWMGAAQSALGLTVAIPLGLWAYRTVDGLKHEYDGGPLSEVAVAAGLVAAFVGLVSAIHLVGALPYLFEPRLYALDQLRGLVGK